VRFLICFLFNSSYITQTNSDKADQMKNLQLYQTWHKCNLCIRLLRESKC